MCIVFLTSGVSIAVHIPGRADPVPTVQTLGAHADRMLHCRDRGRGHRSYRDTGGVVDFDQYVAARYGRLIEHAVLLGCAEGEAGTLVDQVLVEQRKRIRRAEDPDPLVREALEHAIAGTPPDRPSRTGPLVALGLVALAVAVGVALTYRPAPEPMPSLFALDGDQAQRLLEDQGFAVVLRPARSCEPPGLVVGSDPPGGGPVGKGATVTVRTSVLSGSHCEPAYPGRSSAWQFIKFALGDPPPEFADTVVLLVSGSVPRTFVGAEVADRARWREALDLIADAAHRTASTGSGMPLLRVDVAVPPASWCGVRRPAVTGEREAIRFQILTRAARWGRRLPTHRRPLPVGLSPSTRSVDTVVVYATPGLVPGRPRGPAARRGRAPRSAEPGPDQEHRCPHQHRQAGPEVGVDVAGLVGLAGRRRSPSAPGSRRRRRAAPPMMLRMSKAPAVCWRPGAVSLVDSAPPQKTMFRTMTMTSAIAGQRDGCGGTTGSAPRAGPTRSSFGVSRVDQTLAAPPPASAWSPSETTTLSTMSTTNGDRRRDEGSRPGRRQRDHPDAQRAEARPR